MAAIRPAQRSQPVTRLQRARVAAARAVLAIQVTIPQALAGASGSPVLAPMEPGELVQ